MDCADVLVESDPHRRVDNPWGEGVHGDPVLNQSAGRGLRNRKRAELRNAVGNEVPETLTARDRTCVDDLPARSLGDHLPSGLLGADDDAPRVDTNYLLEVRLIDLHESAGSVHPSVVANDVQLAERIDGCSDHRMHVRTMRDVDADRRGHAPGGYNLGSNGSRGVFVKVCNNELGALVCDRSTRGTAYAAGTSRHDHYPVLYAPHLDLRR